MSLFDLNTAVPTMTTISNDIAATYTNVTNLDISGIVNSRQLLQNNITNTDVDTVTKLIQSARSVETSVLRQSSSALSPMATALDTYYRSQTGMKMRQFFKPGVNTFTSNPANITWSNDFRDFWRSAMSEELVVRLGSFSNTTGSFGLFVADKTIQLNSLLELRTPNLIGGNNITATITFATSSGTTSALTVSIPSGTAAGTIIPISKSGRFVSVASAVFANGSLGDIVEVWVS